MKTVKYSADGGSMRVFTNDIAIQFLNNFGDGTFKCFIENTLNAEVDSLGWDFIGAFTVAKHSVAHLSAYDCDNDDSVHTFKEGRYPVYVAKDGLGNMLVGRWS